ncbi:sialate O-acetylesterase [Chitinophaga rhizophila]|uniref:Sialate O-acetylesterase n=1 Tax=Chitinophaga rhizophila TaxID=2866212 RepID=A0ABS7GJB9_9BACT|nr:sialate O-acetylesterase [Chitinophaga rhizophila]MBW8687391.1 sialate O-acetylesterase [Chitinophaga rhizophila]
MTLILRAITGAVLCSLLYTPSDAQVRLPRLVRDSMVLQRDAPVKIWGWATPGEQIRIRFQGKRFSTRTSADSTWSVVMPALRTGGPYIMHIDASNHITLRDILVGDVWFCAGQSNMVHQLALHSERYAADINEAAYPEIRHFKIPQTSNLKTTSTDITDGYWKSATQTDVADFSAVAYFFARDLYRRYKIPIGLINASVGGTPIEAWTSKEGLQAFPSIMNTIHDNESRTAPPPAPSLPALTDAGLDSQPAWYDPSYQPLQWRPINVPGYWEDQGTRDLDGTVWYRREIDIPASMTDKPALLRLGRIVDADIVYVNGKLAGNTTYQYPQRRYQLPAGMLNPGKNLIVVRVTNHAGKGGFIPDKPYYLAAGNDTLDLKGTWHYKVGGVYSTPPPAATFREQNCPVALYNGMVAPVIPYAVKGALWYQGESNTHNAKEYEQLLPALIADWRRQWRQPLPFLFVQLPGFMDVQYLPSESNWAMLREAQRKALKVPNTAMAVTIELGEWNDVHPDRKKEVGDRLALLARKYVYGEKQLIAEGPLFTEAKVDGNKVILHFSNTGTGLTTNDGQPPAQFAIAGADGKFIWAQAKIAGNTVVVWADGVNKPMRVRYAWADNPAQPNLYNREGLPASPFETTTDI